MQKEVSQNKNIKNIYEAIRETHSLIAYCENNGIHFMRIGRSYRTNSPFTNAINAFSIDFSTPDFWHDFSVVDMPNHGDVLELCALLEHHGDKKEAIRQLAPEGYRANIDRYIHDRQEEQEKVQRSHEALKNYPNYIQYLHDRGIDDAQIERLKIGVDVISNSYARLLIPRFNFDGIEALYHKTRRMPDKNGLENPNEEKYKGAYMAVSTFLRNVPLGLQTLRKGGKFLVLCEGDFDTLNFEINGFAVLGSGGGVFSHDTWPLIVSNTENFDEIVLAFDNDDAGKSYTRTIAENLFERNIPFRVVSLPDNCKDVNDFYRTGGNLHELVDDATPGLEFLAMQFIPSEGFDNLSRGKKHTLQENLKSFMIKAKRAGVDDADLVSLCSLLAMTMPKKWLDTVLKIAHKGQSEADIVEAICNSHTLLFNEKTGFYEYNNNAGIWERKDDTVIGSYVREYLGATASTKSIFAVTEHLKRATVSYAPINEFNRLPLFAFKNGTLHYLGEGKSNADLFKEASPSDFVTSRRAFDFDVNATCPEWEKAVRIIFAGDEKRIMCFQEFCGYALLPHCKFHKALYLYGKGRNGKSTLLNVIRALFGDENSTSLEPTEFADRFSLIDLKDSIVNICTDAKNYDLTGAEANLKKAIAGEPIRACFKQKDFITFKPRAKILFACNHELATKDKTDSMTERFLLIDCPVHFVDNPTDESNEVKKDLDIEQKLMQELPGIFNWCVEGAKRLIKQKQFTLTDEQSRITHAFQSPTDSVLDFVTQFSTEVYDVDGNGRKVTRGEVYACYLDFCEATGHEKPIDVSRFHNVFRKALADNHILYNEKQIRGGTRYYDFLPLQA